MMVMVRVMVRVMRKVKRKTHEVKMRKTVAQVPGLLTPGADEKREVEVEEMW